MYRSGVSQARSGRGEYFFLSPHLETITHNTVHVHTRVWLSVWWIFILQESSYRRLYNSTAVIKQNAAKQHLEIYISLTIIWLWACRLENVTYIVCLHKYFWRQQEQIGKERVRGVNDPKTPDFSTNKQTLQFQLGLEFISSWHK